MVKRMDPAAVEAALSESPELIEYRDDAGRNWLHLAAGIDVAAKGIAPAQTVKMARTLLANGLGIDAPAFVEGGDWHATPLWYAVARGRNLPLARFLLEAGSTPEHCLWAATYGEDKAMLSLLLKHGATIDAVAENETPLLHAIKYSRYASARVLLEAGADPDFVDSKGMTALHYLLKKNSDLKFFELMIKHGARVDIGGPDGKTALSVISRKRTPGFAELARQLQN